MDIYSAIHAVLADVGAVGKDATNTFDKYKYRSIEAVMNAMHPAMAKHGVFVTPEVLEVTRDERTSKDGKAMIYSVAKVRYTFWTLDGSSVSAVVCGEGMDRGDKSLNKAMSAAFKYALFQTFCLPTEEMVDSETETPEIAAQPTANDAVADADQRAVMIKTLSKLSETTQAAIAAHYNVEKIADMTTDQLTEYFKLKAEQAKAKEAAKGGEDAAEGAA